jgi:hypothetical protein
MRQTLNPVVAKVLKRLHFPLDVILPCVRWYSAYPLSLRNLEEMMAERGVSVDHSTVHRWAIKLLPVLEKEFRRSKRKVGRIHGTTSRQHVPSRAESDRCIRPGAAAALWLRIVCTELLKRKGNFPGP